VNKQYVVENGKDLNRSVFGISKFFEWKEYDLNGERIRVSQFNDEIYHVTRIYCESCGSSFLPSRIKETIDGYLCLSCNKNING